MRTNELRGIDESKKDKRVWIIQDDVGRFLNENKGFGGDNIAEFISHKDAVNQAEFLSDLYKKDYWVFELTDHVEHQSIVNVHNLRQ